MRRLLLNVATILSLLSASGASLPATTLATTDSLAATDSLASTGCGTSSYRLDVTIRQRVTNSFIGSGWFSESVYRCWNGSSFTSGPSWVSRTWGGASGIFTSVSQTDSSHPLLNTFWDYSSETDWSFSGAWCSHKVYQEIWLANDDGSAGAVYHGDDCLQEYLTITIH